MMNLKTLIVARREYVTNFRRPVYIFTAFLFPLILGLVMYIVFLLVDDAETSREGFGRVGYVDLSTAEVLRDINAEADGFFAFESEDAAREAFDSNSIDAYLVISEDYLINGGQVDVFATQNPSELFRDDVQALLIQGLVTLAPADSNPNRLRNPLDIATFRFLNDNSTFEEPEDFLARFFLPFGFAFFLYTSITITSQFLMSSIVEEKESRMMEVLTTSCTPGQLLWGKLLGLGAISLTQIFVWAAIVLGLGASQANIGEFIERGNIGLTDFMTFLGLYVLTFFLFAGLSVGVGAIASAEQEARQLAVVFTIAAVIPMAFITIFLTRGSVLAIILVLFPLTSPVSILLARAYGAVDEIYLWIGVLLLMASIVGVMWASVRLFRVGMLMYGQRLSVQQIWQAIRRLA